MRQFVCEITHVDGHMSWLDVLAETADLAKQQTEEKVGPGASVTDVYDPESDSDVPRVSMPASFTIGKVKVWSDDLKPLSFNHNIAWDK